MSQVALITGGTRGIGYGIAVKLADCGIDLALNGVREESEVTEVLEELRGKGGRVIYCRGDVSKKTDREAILTQMRDTYGKLNILVNNAGVSPAERADILESSEESYDRVMRINLKGPYFLTQAAANWMVEQRKAGDFTGYIINISSISATVASPDRGEYCLSKAGIAMATQLWAMRLAEYDIPVYEVRPGIVKTDMTATVEEKYNRMIGEGLIPQKRWGYPDDVGKAVAVLVRGNFHYSTGEYFMVDGGMTVQRL